MKKAHILLALFLLAGNLLATPQIPDILVYDGKEYPLQHDLLGSYFEKFPDRNPKDEDFGICSALWRGYQAKFEVVNGKIYFTELLSNSCFEARATQLKKVIPDGKPLFIDWVSSLLGSGYGTNIEDPYSLESLDAYEKYSFFEVSKGFVKEVRHFDNKGYKTFKKKQFQAFRKSPEFEAKIKAMVKGDSRITRKDAVARIEQGILWYTSSFLVD